MSVTQLLVGARLRLAWWRRVYPASFVLAGITALILWVAVADLLGQGSLAAVLSAGRAELAAPLLMALVVATGICERIWPAERRPVLARGHVQDACYLALHAIVVIPLMTLLSVGAATLIGGHPPWIELRCDAALARWLLVPLTIVAMDGANWLAHYADHRLDSLWRFHALHHSQEELSVLTSFRAHPLMHTTGFLLATIPVDGADADASDRAGADHGLRLRRHPAARQHPVDLRPARPGAGQPRLPPAAPCAGQPGRQPRRRADDLGHPGRPGEVPGRGDAAGRTGLDGRPVPVEQGAPAAPALLLCAGQLIEPFQAQR